MNYLIWSWNVLVCEFYEFVSDFWFNVVINFFFQFESVFEKRFWILKLLRVHYFPFSFLLLLFHIFFSIFNIWFWFKFKKFKLWIVFLNEFQNLNIDFSSQKLEVECCWFKFLQKLNQSVSLVSIYKTDQILIYWKWFVLFKAKFQTNFFNY